MNKSYGAAVTRTIDPVGYSYDNFIGRAGKPLLDSELNLGQDIAGESRASILRRLLPSGWTQMSAEGETYSFDLSGAASNTLSIHSVDSIVALVNGWEIVVVPTNGTRLVDLGAPSAVSGTREIDFVFLEVWRVQLDSTAAHKAAGAPPRIFLNGNVEEAWANCLTDDIVDPTVGAETTQRVQIQHRIRVHRCNLAAPASGNPETYPYILGDPAVLAQGATAAPVATYSFTHQAPGASPMFDPGLWIAGTGNAASRTDLDTVDGYVYAIPLAAVPRRNSAGFAVMTDHQGAVSAPAATDRPDGLLANTIVTADIIDLRMRPMARDSDWASLCERGLDALEDERTLSEWENTQLANGAIGKRVLRVDEIGDLDTAAAHNIGTFDGIRRRFSDRTIVERWYVTVLPASAPGGDNDWDPGDTYTLALPAEAAAAGARITDIKDIRVNVGTALARQFWKVAGLGGTSVTLTVGIHINNLDIYVEAEVTYDNAATSAGAGVRRTPISTYAGLVSVAATTGAGATFASNVAAFDALLAARIADWNAFEDTRLDPEPDHREFRFVYQADPRVVNIYLETGTNYVIIPELAENVTSVVIDPGGAAIEAIGRTTWTADDPLRRLVIAPFPEAAGTPLMRVTYNPLKPFAHMADLNILVCYTADAVQTLPGYHTGGATRLPASLLVQPLWVSPRMYAATMGPGSWELPFPFRNPTKHLPVQAPVAGVARSYDQFLNDIPYLPLGSEWAVSSGRAGEMIAVTLPTNQISFTGPLADVEDRNYYTDVSSGYHPIAQAQPLGTLTDHQNYFPVLARITTASWPVGPRGQIVLLVYTKRCTTRVADVSVEFDTPAANSYSCVGVYHLPGRPIVRQ